MLDRANTFILKVCEIIIGILTLCMTLVVLLGVYHRYILGNALAWSEVLARYCMIWSSFLAASILLREDGHLGITYLRDIAPPKLRKIIKVAGDLVIIAFLALWLQSSWEAYQLIKYDNTPGLNIPLGWVFISQPVCALLMLIQAAFLLTSHVMEKPSPKAGGEARS